MTIQEALYLVRKQIQDNEQNKQVLEVLEQALGLDEPTYTLKHLFGDVEYDLSKLKLVDERTCERYENIEDNNDE